MRVAAGTCGTASCANFHIDSRAATASTTDYNHFSGATSPTTYVHDSSSASAASFHESAIASASSGYGDCAGRVHGQSQRHVWEHHQLYRLQIREVLFEVLLVW